MTPPLKTYSRSGFTLVELMVVVSIIAVLAAFATPTLSRSSQRAAARDAARAYAGVLRNARTQAMTRGEVVLVTVQPTDQNNLVVIRSAPQLGAGGVDGPARNCSQLLGLANNPFNEPGLIKQTLRGVNFDASVQLERVIVGNSMNSNNVNICFSPDGRVLGGNGAPLTSSYLGGGFIAVFRRTEGAGVSPTIGPPSQYMPSTTNAGDPILMKVERDLVDLHAVELSFNGGINVFF